MPGRAIRNKFLKDLEVKPEPIQHCFHCLEKCNPKNTPYCITKALINAVEGNLDQGLIFCGSNAARLTHMTTVPELMKELVQ